MTGALVLLASLGGVLLGYALFWITIDWRDTHVHQRKRDAFLRQHRQDVSRNRYLLDEDGRPE